MLRNIAWYYMVHIDKYTVSFGIVCYSMGLHCIVWYRIVRVPNLYFGSRLGLQYPKNSKIFLWLLPQPSSGNALVCVDKNWNISGLLSGFQLEKLFFIHTVRSYSHSTATAEFVTSIGLKKWDGFLTFSTVFVKITQEKSQILPRTNLKVLKCEKYSWSEASDDITNPAVAFTNSAVAVEWL